MASTNLASKKQHWRGIEPCDNLDMSTLLNELTNAQTRLTCFHQPNLSYIYLKEHKSAHKLPLSSVLRYSPKSASSSVVRCE